MWISAECKILSSKRSSGLREQCVQLDQQKLNHENPSELLSAKFKILNNYCMYGSLIVFVNNHTSLFISYHSNITIYLNHHSNQYNVVTLLCSNS